MLVKPLAMRLSIHSLQVNSVIGRLPIAYCNAVVSTPELSLSPRYRYFNFCSQKVSKFS